MWAPAGTTTFLSRIARRTTAPRPTCTPSSSTDACTTAASSTVTSGAMTECVTWPVTIDPAHTIELDAEPPATNFAGGRCEFGPSTGHCWLYRLKIGWTEIRS